MVVDLRVEDKILVITLCRWYKNESFKAQATKEGTII